MTGFGEYFERIKNIIKSSNTSSDPIYERIICNVCNQICYNKKDLRIHIKKDHPDLKSTTST